MNAKALARWKAWPATALALTLAASCGKKDDDKEESGKRVSAVLRSSKLAAQNLHLTQDTVLVNVTGLADSIGLSGEVHGGNGCGFNVWAADGQDSRAGMEGRTYESFNLGDPTSWSSLGWGLQGDCDSITVWQVESYFAYMDLELSVNGASKVVRAYMSQQAPFEAGDIVLNNGGTLYWYDTASESLVVSTQDRPTSPARFDLPKEVPWHDNNGTQKIIMMEFRIDVDKMDYVVTKKTGHVDVDVDFTNSGLTIADTSSDEAIMKTISLPFLEDGDLLQAALTISEDRPADTPAQ